MNSVIHANKTNGISYFGTQESRSLSSELDGPDSSQLD